MNSSQSHIVVFFVCQPVVCWLLILPALVSRSSFWQVSLVDFRENWLRTYYEKDGLRVPYEAIERQSWDL